MKISKLIWLITCEMGREIWNLPQAAVRMLKQRRTKVENSKQEAERLDRIRNPSNYRGK